MLTIYLRQYKPLILETLDTKKQNLGAVIETLAFHCTTTLEKATILQRLKTFQRAQGESFAACISRFDGMHVFYLQLDQPSEAEQVRLLSYQTVTPYLISAKCASAFGQWIVESVKLQTEITKESIIRIVTSLESHVELRITTSRQLPGFMITSTLNLPPGETDVTLQAHAAVGVTPTPLQTHKSPSRSGSSSRPPYPPSGRPPSPKPRPPSPGKPPFSKSRSRDRDNQPRRKPSPSPNRNTKVERGRSPSAHPSSSAPRSASTNAYMAELDVLQYYSIHSQSPSTNRKRSMSSVFRRPLTPKTYSDLKGSYFFKTNPERFKTVWKDGRCLRCWSKEHRAAACPVYTKPTPSPCRFCHYLYHPSDLCLYYDAEGKSKPASRSTSAK